MRILVLNYEYPPLGGGAGVISKNISERLAGIGHKVTVVTTWYKDEKEIEEESNLKVIRLKSKRRYTHKSSVPEMISWIKKCKVFLKGYCNKGSFDLCFANFAIPGGIVALHLKGRFNLRYSIISHGHDIPWRYPAQMRFFHLANYYRIKKICSNSEANFVQTTEMFQNINQFLGRKQETKNYLIPNGIDAGNFFPDYSKRSKQFKILFTGRLVKQKDPFTFLEAIKLFSGKNTDFIVHVIGDGVLRPEMERFVKANSLKKKIKFLGWITAKEISKEYQSAHVCIISSVFEGMSVAALESIACGCFLISTPIDGIREIIYPSENGVIVNFRSPSETEKEIERFYNEKYLKNYIIPDGITEKLLAEYNWDRIVKQYDMTFNKVIDRV